MPKILITGNGFDLNLGLPTTYNDFMNILKSIEEAEKLDFDTIYSKTSTYNKIRKYFNKFEFDTNKIEKLKQLIKKNKWYNFFKKEYELDTWVDFEDRIEYALKLIFNDFQETKHQIFQNKSLQRGKLDNIKIGFQRNIEIVGLLKDLNIIDGYNKSIDGKISLSGYESNNLVDYTINIFKINLNEKFLIKRNDYYIDFDFEKIYKYLLDELNDFKLIFNYYFEIFIQPLIDNYKKTSDIGYFKNFDTHYTFNYTPTFDKIFGKENQTQFLHGKIGSKENKIVLGISEIPQELKQYKKYILPFTKYFQKLDINTDYKFILKYLNNLPNNYHFYFWGHSLDKSDEDYINTVFDFVNKINGNKKIIIIYHNKKAKSKLLNNLLYIRKKEEIENLMKCDILVFLQSNSQKLKELIELDIRYEPYF